MDEFDDHLNDAILFFIVVLEVWYFIRFKFPTERIALIVLLANLGLSIARVCIPEGEDR